MNETGEAVDSNTGDLSHVIENLSGVFQNYGIVVLILAAIGGVVLAGYAAVKLHTHLNDYHMMAHQSTTTSVFGCLLGIVIGGLITISSVIVTWFGLLYG